MKNNSTVLVYGRTYPPCQYCESAKELLGIEGYEYEFVELDKKIKSLIEGKEKREIKTVPQIYIDDKYIGGYRELVAHIKDSKIIQGLEL